MAYGVNGEKSEVLMQTLSNNTKIKRILGFNEPDQENQSNVSVKTALTEWSKLEETGLPLVSPSAAKPLGTWMEKFMTKIEEECRRVDWIGVHWYGPAMFSTFTTQMRKIRAKFGGRPLLLTEFAVADHQSEERGFHRYNHSEVLEFMKEALPWLEEQDWIAGYAWFSFKQSKIKGSSSALFEDDDGQLTALGRFYASVSTENPKGDQSIDIT
jgi:Glycosyl hydrolase catalytic core